MVVLAVSVDRLEACAARADVDALDMAVSGELFECPIDARDTDSAAGRAQLIEDLLDRDAARLSPEKLDHGPAGAAVAVTSRLQGGESRLGPGVCSTRVGHGAK